MRKNWQLPTFKPDGPLERNVKAIAKFEQEKRQRRTLSDRIGDAIADFAGRMVFVIINLVWYVAWIVINAGLIPGIEPFDPYPFTFLTLCVSLEAIFLSIFVLMNQNRSARLADLRTQISLQLDMLEEEENTRILELLLAVVDHLGIDSHLDEEEVSELLGETQVETVAEKLEEELSKKTES
jgi:uncharacterized membrane protein